MEKAFGMEGAESLPSQIEVEAKKLQEHIGRFDGSGIGGAADILEALRIMVAKMRNKSQ